MKRLLYTLTIMCLLFNCNKDEAGPQEVVIEEALQVYFENFQIEAAERGIQIDFEQAQVGGTIASIPGGVLGQCQFNSNAPDRIVIDQNYWNRISAIKREFIVFHELGHCILDRRHLDDTNQNGDCVSMMHSGEGGCRNNYNAITRTEYLDELFGE